MAHVDGERPDSERESVVVRTEHGLVFAQRPRVSLYDAMDYLRAGYPPRLVADRLRLSERQIRAAVDYIATHPEETEREYREIVDEAEARRRYWEARNRERLAQIAETPPPPEQRELRARLAALKAREERLAQGSPDDNTPHSATGEHVSAR